MAIPLSRRSLLQALAPWGILTLLVRRDALAAPAKSEARRFLTAVDAAARDLWHGQRTALEWQDRVEELARTVDIDDLRRATDFDRMARALSLEVPGQQRRARRGARRARWLRGPSIAS